MRSIERLPDSVRSSMRSGVVLFDLTRVVEELVFNSLDAGATKVSVALGIGTCCIKVADNGYGITRDGLVLLGERYATSKVELMAGIDIANESFGFRGEALGSISDVSLLEIVTKAHGMPNGYRKVIKGCKCLYLGIEDDRQDVGTTVVVRDLFYNQPVRRKHLQSSPKKVLHSVRESVLRIALVHLKVSFKMIDMESGEELLCTHPSLSPLALLTSSFGVTVSSSLQRLDVSDSLLKLSGYVSSPSLPFSVKAFQYFYINSRFISKGTIHKLLNQLAARFNYLDVMKDNINSHKGKRSRSQMCPTYILNLRCPRAHYDLTFEPSRTAVEFKDWDHVLGFIDKAISQVWSQMISYVQEDSLIHAADMSPEEVIWEEAAHTLPTTEDAPTSGGISEQQCRSQSCQDFLGFPAPSFTREIKESKHLPAWSNGRFSCGISKESAFQLEDFQTGTSVACASDCSFESSDDYLVQCGMTALQEDENNVGIPGKHASFPEDHYYQNEFARERSNECYHLLPSRWEGVGPKNDSNNSDGFSGDYFDIADDVDLKKPSLRGCSSQVSLVADTSCFDKFESTEFQATCSKKKKRACDDDWYTREVSEIGQSIEPKIVSNKSSRLSRDSIGTAIDVEKVDEDFMKPSPRSCSSKGRRFHDGACFANVKGLEFQADRIRKDKRLHNDNWDHIEEVDDIEHVIRQKVDSSKRISGDYFEIANYVRKVDDDLKKSCLWSCSTQVSRLLDGRCSADSEGSEFRKKSKWIPCHDWDDIGGANNIENCSEAGQDVAATVWSSRSITSMCDVRSGLLSPHPFTSTRKCIAERVTRDDPVSPIRSSRNRSRAFDPECSLSPEPKFLSKMSDFKNVDDDASGWNLKHHKAARSDFMADTEGEDDILIFDSMQISYAQENHSLSAAINSSRAPLACTSGRGDLNEFHEDSILFPESTENFLDEAEWLKYDSLRKGNNSKREESSSYVSLFSYLDEVKTQTVSSSAAEKSNGSRMRSRSCSAPPFYKAKKKFFALNSWPTMETGKSHFETIYGVRSQEASDLNNILEPSGLDLRSLNVVDDSPYIARQDVNTTAEIAENRNCEMEDRYFDICNAGSIEGFKADIEPELTRKGLSCLLDFTSRESEGKLDSGSKWQNNCPSTTKGEKSDGLSNRHNILDITSGILHLSGESLVPRSISKKFLEDAKVLQQIDRKFIPVVAGGILAVIDQHAADERIRLEELRQKVLSGQMKTVTHLEAEQELVLPEIGYQLLHNYAEQIQKWGWICNFHSRSSKSFKKNLNILHRQPSVATLLAVPCILGVNLTDVDLSEFLQQLSDTDGSSTLPQAVLRVLNYKACRGAIMFGDKLLPSECSLIVEELKHTSLCFQCAHGRPTTVPLVDLNALHKQIAKLDMLSGSSVESWHGTQRHKPSLERAAQRLSSD